MAIYDVHGNVLSESDIVVDKTLTKSGQAADAAVVGNRLNSLSEEKVNFPKDDTGAAQNGTSGQILQTNGDGTTKWVDKPGGGGAGTVTSVNGNTPDENGNVEVEVGQPTDEQISTAVSSYLDAHPEATTTVQDGAITNEKLADDAVTPQKTVFFNETTRIFYSGTVTSTTKVDISGRTSAFMRMHPNGSGCMNTSLAQYAVTKIEIFDSTDTVISTISGNPLDCTSSNADGIYTLTKTLEIPDGASYAIFAINNYYGGTPTLILATEEITDDEDMIFSIADKYKEPISSEVVGSKAFSEAVNEAVEIGKSEALSFVSENYLAGEPSLTSNLLDYTDLVEGFITYNEKKGIYYDKSQTWCVDMYSTKPIPVEPSTEYNYKFFGSGNYRTSTSAVLELGSNMEYVNYTLTSSHFSEFTTQDNTAYLILTFNIEGMKQGWFGKVGEKPIYYVPYVRKITDQTVYVPQNNIISGLSNKKWNALGDSWTAGDTGYVSRIAEKTGMIARNYGISSSTISEMNDGGSDPMCVRYTDMDDDADLVTVMGGINDHTAIITAIDYGDIDSTDTATFYGGWNVLLSGLRTKYPNAIILVFTNGDCDPGTRGDAEGRVAAIKAVCEKHRIPCFDILHNLGYTYKNYQTDMVHLTAAQVENNLTPLVYNFIKQHFML